MASPPYLLSDDAKGRSHAPETQRRAADKAVALLRGYEATGTLPSVQTPTLREETWARVARRWLEVIEAM